jgi:hypothetical protein
MVIPVASKLGRVFLPLFPVDPALAFHLGDLRRIPE